MRDFETIFFDSCTVQAARLKRLESDDGSELYSGYIITNNFKTFNFTIKKQISTGIYHHAVLRYKNFEDSFIKIFDSDCLLLNLYIINEIFDKVVTLKNRDFWDSVNTLCNQASSAVSKEMSERWIFHTIQTLIEDIEEWDR